MKNEMMSDSIEEKSLLGYPDAFAANPDIVEPIVINDDRENTSRARQKDNSVPKKLGRPPTAKAKSEDINKLHFNRRYPAKRIAQELGISLSSVYRYLETPRRPAYIRAIAAEANRVIRKRQKEIGGSRNFYRLFPELKEDYNPNLAQDEDDIDNAMSTIAHDSTLWKEFKYHVYAELGAKEMKRGEREFRKVMGDEIAEGPMTEEQVAEIREQILSIQPKRFSTKKFSKMKF